MQSRDTGERNVLMFFMEERTDTSPHPCDILYSEKKLKIKKLIVGIMNFHDPLHDHKRSVV